MKIPGNNPANTAPAGNLFDDVRTGSTLAGLLVPVALVFDEVVDVAVGLIEAEADIEGAAFVELSMTQIFDWHSYPSGQHWVPQSFNDAVGSPICKDEFGYNEAF
jgi:hypothetical protein